MLDVAKRARDTPAWDADALPCPMPDQRDPVRRRGRRRFRWQPLAADLAWRPVHDIRRRYAQSLLGMPDWSVLEPPQGSLPVRRRAAEPDYGSGSGSAASAGVLGASSERMSIRHPVSRAASRAF